jgi:hypothetical protein
MADNPRWTNRPAGSTWGDFGADDERGRLNLLTPEKVLQGIAEVKLGKTFCLSLPLDYPGGAILSPRRHPPVLKPTMRGDRPNMNYPLRCDDPTATDIVCDDTVLLTLQYSTQWDSLAHVGQTRCSTPMATAAPRMCSTTGTAQEATSSARPITTRRAT